ncbi:S8 family serine peptidase [Streptomyces sp. RS10V-4]|uniref:S8 family serine peptidase n=1 Tax=Streptomyces rhizoryzae TaxID=2932493 RepID=UPI0020033468|nr:S8 family serine peptidase [Streptomyces rhizoryzae]MCK7622303.1 S8 family serine peptidase [Streptomyces rhizoryzae]
MARITINGVTVDPLVQSQELAGASLVSEDASASNYLLVQTTHVPSAEEKARLAELGVVIHEYVPESTYLCGYRPSDLAAVRALDFVAWADVYLKGFKLAPSLRSGRLRPGVAVLADPLEVLKPRSRTVDVVLHQDVDPGAGAVQERVAEAGGVGTGDIQAGRRKVRMTIPEEALPALTSLDEIRHIEEVPEMGLCNAVAGKLLHARIALDGTEFAGAGQVVAVADTGLDLGSPEDVHPAFRGRVARLIALGRTGPDRADDPDGHGTHVSGSVLGDGNSETMGGPVAGTAPKATLVLQSLLDDNGALSGIPADLQDLFGPPYTQDGARVHTNSWGPIRPGVPYNEQSAEIDQMVWDHKNLVICFAAGNAGRDQDQAGRISQASVSGPACAKNCITVGASESERPEIPLTYGQLSATSFPVNPIHDDRQADNPAGMAAFSSRGPTQEGRTKPDLVAPGTSILSTHSRAAKFSTVFGVSDDPAFFFDSGTSMATPLVAGCVAVLRETLVKNGTPDPSAALLKALLINGADDLPGQYDPSEAGPSPNNNSGFGLVNLENAIVLPGTDHAGCTDADALEQDAERTFTLTVPEGGHGLKATLVWSDPPGPALQNDLDLIVRAGGQERHGNMGTDSGFDRVNNVEQVRWEGVPGGEVQVVVRAHRITQFAQPYAVAWRLV